MKIGLKRIFTNAAVLLVAAILAGASGCEQPDYQPLIFKKKLRDLDDKIEALEKSVAEQAGSSELSAGVRAELDSLKKEISELKKANELMSTELLAGKKEADAKAVAAFEDLGAIVERDPESGFVTKIDLTDVRYENKELRLLLNCPKLKDLALYGPSADVETFEIVGQMRALEKLAMERAPASAEALEKLKPLQNLKFLQLFRATLSPESLAVIATFDGLEQLRCGQTRVGDDGLVHLKEMKSLRAIDLSDCNRVSDQSLELLSGLPNLTFLKVYGPQITDQGLVHVAKMKSLRVLGLNDTGVTDEGIKKLDGLNLSEIHLFRTRVGDEGIELIAKMSNLKWANLRDTAISDAAISYLSNSPNLVKLDLSECKSPGITDASAPEFAKMKKLNQLNLWRTSFTDEGINSLVSMKNLSWLNLDNTKVTDAGVKLLEQMPQLTWLHVGSNKQVTDESVDVLSGLKNLKYLNISFTGISEDGFFDIDDALAPNGCVVVGQ